MFIAGASLISDHLYEFPKLSNVYILKQVHLSDQPEVNTTANLVKWITEVRAAELDEVSDDDDIIPTVQLNGNQ